MNKIQTQRLLLKTISKEDYPRLYEAWISMSVFRNISFLKNKLVFEIIKNFYLSQDGIFWLIELLDEGKIIGTCEFNNINLKNNSVDIGCELIKVYRKKGYMFEALSSIINKGFIEYELKNIFVNIDTNNIDSINLFKKLGFLEIPENVDIKNIKRFVLSIDSWQKRC